MIKAKKIFVVIALVSVILWFSCNVGIFLLMKYYLSHQEQIDYVPQRLVLAAATIQRPSICFKDLKLKLPFPSEERKITSVHPYFGGSRLFSILIFMKDKENSHGTMSISSVPNRIDGKPSVFERIIFYDLQYYQSDVMKAIYYSKRTDFSWWDLRHNLRLFSMLILKDIGLSTAKKFGDVKVYDLQTPYLDKGFLEDARGATKSLTTFHAVVGDRFYNIDFFNMNKDMTDSIISNAEMVKNSETCYREMQQLYDNKGSTYPDELLLLCLISIKGPSIENLGELIRILERKAYSADDIKRVRDQISALAGSGKQRQ